MAELKRLGFPATHARLSPGLLLPLHTTDGQQPFSIFRPDTPDYDANHRPRKYLFPRGQSMRLDCPPRCHARMGDPATPLWITEGQKKADALASAGATALALLGVWNLKGKNAFGGVTVLADFDYVAWKDGTGKGRDVLVVYDSDLNTKPQIRKALERLTEHLSRRGATIRPVYLPADPNQKVGVDDYLAAGHTLTDLEALIQQPRPQPQPAPAAIELLECAPACMRRPLAMIQGRMYAAIWAYVRVTTTETLDTHGEVRRFAQPEVTTEQRLLVLRDDGLLFGEGGTRPLSELGIEVHLPETPGPDKLWSVPGVKAYIAGERPDPATLFRQLILVVHTFMDFDRSLAPQQTMGELVACYILATWFLDAMTVIGYLWPHGEKGSGKTQLLTLIAELAYLGQVMLAGGSYATLRDLADYGATLAFDDAEHVMDLQRGDPDKRTLLLAGNRRGNYITVKEPVNGRAWRTRHVATFCPRLFSAIRLPDNVLASRTIIVPLIRTANRRKANADVLESRLWPVPKAQLVDDCWALALTHGATLRKYDGIVADTSSLLGRTLEPWRAILAVAHWLTDCGVTDLAGRIEALAQDYQKERHDLEEGDLTPLVIQALCEYGLDPGKYRHAPTPVNPNNPINPVTLGSMDDIEISFLTADITAIVQEIAAAKDNGPDPERISARRVGRVFGSLRLHAVPRSSGKAQPGAPKPSRARVWRMTKRHMRELLLSYHLDVPEAYETMPCVYPPLHGVNGVVGVHGGENAMGAGVIA
jgi:hypothetical protein